MSQWIFRGKIERRNVDFYITADTEAEAIAKAEFGEYDDYETAVAETANWTIDPKTGELNE